ncbi:class C sortase [Enterococcus sp. CWB-B31]|uniref:sortase family protein n=1 Tax=Enterococcus sp. CWB-B31 TaxID=2885159 RepID=UPI001E3D805B|nr:class C sortase [Enterococcus sp. CWB-B31]MCB5953525.1 class C sortase [Enterococcus sp. CWB-B31]
MSKPKERKKKIRTNTNKKASNSERKNVSILKAFSIIMILFGVGVLLYPIAGNFLANRQRSEVRARYDEATKLLSEDEIKEQWERAEAYNEYIFSSQQGKQLKEIVTYESIIDTTKVMGTLDIPSINIKGMPFYHGTTYKTLDLGLGHYQASSIPIGGNNTRAVITGHSGVENQVLFTDIRNLEEGDIFFINILDKKLAYEITSFEEVLPSDVDKVKVEKGKDQVTLLTCTPPGINTYRLLVNGERIPYEEAAAREITKRNLWSYQTIVLFSLGTCLVLFIVLWVIYRRLLKQSKADDTKKVIRAKRNIRLFLYTIRGLFICLLLTMIGILCVALYGYFQMNREVSIESINIGQQEELSAFNEEKIINANYEERQISSVNIENYAVAKNNLQRNINDYGIGKLYIPDEEISLPILAGLYNENLLNGVATYRYEQRMGVGNYVLLAHNIYNQDVLLYRIDKLQKGSLIYTTDFQNVYVYEVIENKIIEDSEVEYIENQSMGEHSIVTLIRCEGNVGTRFRRLVQGRLVNTQTFNEVPTLLKKMNLTREAKTVDGVLLEENPVSPFEQFSIEIAASILSDPVQTLIPLILLLIFPVIFLCFI